MTIETKEGRYFIAQWYAPLPVGDLMWVAYSDSRQLEEESEESEWVVRGRIRIYVDDKTEDSEDVKRWFQVTFDGSEDAAAAFASRIYETGMFSGTPEAKEMVRHIRRSVQTLSLRTSDQERVIDLLLKQPYAHVQPTSRGGDV